MDRLLHPLELVHQRLVHVEAAGGIQKDHVAAVVPGVAESVLGDLHRVPLALLKDRQVQLAAHHLQLLDGGGAVHVAGHEQGAFGLLRFQHLGQLGREGRLTRTLQTRHEDNRWVLRQVEVGRFATHQGSQFVVHDFDHQLSRLHGGEHVLSQRLGFYGIGKLFGNFVVDVGIEQGTAHIFERLGHVDFGDFAFTLQYFKRPFKSFTKVFKHNF